VHAGDHRALLLYFLLLTKASGGTWNSSLPAAAWARALNHPLPNTKGAISTISKTWFRLERQQLVRRARVRRMADVTLLKEDGSGEEYIHPGKAGGKYFKLPLALWTAGPDDEHRWYQVLTLPELAMVVIARSLYDGFPLPYERAPDWYGISPDTASRGTAKLAERGLLEIDTEYRKEPLSATGWTTVNHFTLLDPLGPVGPRAATRKSAEVATDQATDASKTVRVRRSAPRLRTLAPKRGGRP
jgi:hypothetical protein